MSMLPPEAEGEDAAPAQREEEDAPRPAFGDRRAVAIRWLVPPDCDGLPAEQVLARKVRRLGEERARRVLHGGDLRVDGRPLAVGEVLRKGALLELWRIAPDDPDAPFPSPVILEDDPATGLVVLDKPGDLAVHPSARYLHHTVTGWLRRRGLHANPCHRLDRETSGVLVCARPGPAEVEWKTAFQRGLVEKSYLAVVRGLVRAPFSVDARLALQGDRGLVRIRMIEDPAGREALTDVEPVRIDETRGRSLVRCRPRTGRQHQIRAHLALAGFPIVGDKLYAMGDRWFDAFTRRALTDEQRAALEHPRQALHAAELSFGQHRFQAPLPPAFAALVAPSEPGEHVEPGEPGEPGEPCELNPR
jgi:23S rRNA pseudouridine1911/1915/1917 synthase